MAIWVFHILNLNCLNICSILILHTWLACRRLWMVGWGMIFSCAARQLAACQQEADTYVVFMNPLVQGLHSIRPALEPISHLIQMISGLGQQGGDNKVFHLLIRCKASLKKDKADGNSIERCRHSLLNHEPLCNKHSHSTEQEKEAKQQHFIIQLFVILRHFSNAELSRKCFDQYVFVCKEYIIVYPGLAYWTLGYDWNPYWVT